MFGAAMIYDVVFLSIFIYTPQDLRGGSERIIFKAIDLDKLTVGTFVSPDPSPISVVAVITPTVAFCAVRNPTVVTPEVTTDPTIASSPVVTDNPEGTSTGPSSFVFLKESTLTLKLMIGMVKDLREF
jgi:hypothetical protein